MIRSKFTTSLKVLSAACMFALSAAAQAQITAFSDDFESYGVQGLPFAPTFTPPWNGFSDNCGFPGGYVFQPSTNGPQISALAYNGVDNQYWNTYGNYDNAVCQTGGGPNPAEEIFLYREFTFTTADTANGGAWVFTFNYRDSTSNPPAGSTETAAYIRVFDPVFNILFETQLDTRGAADWTAGKLVLPIDPEWQNGLVQVGVRNKVQAYESSGVWYDDMNFFQAPSTPMAIKSLGPGGDSVHAHHDGSPEAVAGLDDVVRVNVFGQQQTAGDPTDFDAGDIDESSVRFGRNNSPVNPSLLQRTGTVDVDSDGILDSQYRFLVSDTGITCDDSSAVLTGELVSTGETFSGTDSFNADCNALCHN